MTLDDRLTEALRHVADGVSVPDPHLEAVRSRARRTQRQTVGWALTTLVALVVAGTAVVAGRDASAPEPVGPFDPPTSTGTVPTTTQRVYLAAQPWGPCQYLDEMLAPLTVAGPGYTTTVEPTKDCQVQEYGNVPMTFFIYDVPMPEDGKVSVTPGDQPAAELDAAKVATQNGIHRTHGVTVVYTREAFGEYEPTFIWGKRQLGGRTG